MSLQCPHCNGGVQWTTEIAGQPTTCPYCANVFTMPEHPPAVASQQRQPPPEPQIVHVKSSDSGCVGCLLLIIIVILLLPFMGLLFYPAF